MNMFRLALCDLRRMFKDKMLLFWWLVMPLGFIYIFAQIMNSPQNRTVWIPVFNHDSHELSTLFIDELRTDGYAIDVRKATDEVYVKNWPRAIIIPATFSVDVLKGDPVRLTFTKGQGNMEQLLSAQTRLFRTIAKFTGALASADVVKNRWTKVTRETFLDELKKEQPLRAVNTEHPALRPPPVGFALTLPGYLIMFVMMNSIMYGGVTLAEERANKQLIRLIAAPVSSLELFLGKMLARMLQPAMQSGLILLVGYLLFGVPLGDHPWVLFPVIACFSFFCGTLGILFGTVCSSEKQVFSLGILTTMVFAALGGCWWPPEIASDKLKYAAMCTPTYWSLQGMHDVMSFGKSLSGVLPECSILLLFSAVVLSVAIPLFEWRKRSS